MRARRRRARTDYPWPGWQSKGKENFSISFELEAWKNLLRSPNVDCLCSVPLCVINRLFRNILYRGQIVECSWKSLKEFSKSFLYYLSRALDKQFVIHSLLTLERLNAKWIILTCLRFTFNFHVLRRFCCLMMNDGELNLRIQTLNEFGVI